LDTHDTKEIVDDQNESKLTTNDSIQTNEPSPQPSPRSSPNKLPPKKPSNKQSSPKLPTLDSKDPTPDPTPNPPSPVKLKIGRDFTPTSKLSTMNAISQIIPSQSANTTIQTMAPPESTTKMEVSLLFNQLLGIFKFLPLLINT